MSCFKKYLKNKKWAELYWDKKNFTIGFMPLMEETEDSFSIIVHREENSPFAIVNAKQFISDNRIIDNLEGKKTFKVEESKDGMLLVRLKKPKK